MKTLFLLFFITSTTFCSGQLPTIAEIYNYSEGDTFQLLQTANSGGGFYNYFAFNITSRIDYPDSISYMELTIGNNPTSSFTITDLDSSVTYLLYSKMCPVNKICQIDSEYTYLLNNSTVYGMNARYQDQILENCAGEPITTAITVYANAEAIEGLGVTQNGYYYNGQCVRGGGNLKLIYAHKADGTIYGNAHSSLYTKINSITENAISVTPNPSQGFITIHTNELLNQHSNFVLYNACGQLVASYNLPYATNTVSAENLPPGCYLWQIVTNGNTIKRGKIFYSN